MRRGFTLLTSETEGAGLVVDSRRCLRTGAVLLAVTKGLDLLSVVQYCCNLVCRGSTTDTKLMFDWLCWSWAMMGVIAS